MRVEMFLPRHCIAAVFLLALPAIVQAQFTYTTNDNTITITGYNGPGGAVIIPDTTNGYPVIGISDFAFEDATDLTSVTIPGTVTNIGEGPFLGCSSLTNISVNATNPVYLGENGVLIDWRNYTLVQYPNGLTNETYTIDFLTYYPYGVTNIGPYAFASCDNLRSVTYAGNGSSIYTIGDYAFAGCTDLSLVVVTNTLGYATGTPTSIGIEAFSYCTSLSRVYFVTSATNIGQEAFAFCTNLTAVYFPGNAPLVAANAFYDDSDAVVYYLPGTTNWGPTFGGAPAAEETFEFPYTVYSYGGSIYITGYNGPGGAVVIPDTINGYTVVGIENAFANLRTNIITSVVIPNTVTNIIGTAFADCRSLTNIIIPDSVIGITGLPFENCTRLTSITIPSSVTTIEGEVFKGCTNLTSVYFQGNAPVDIYDAFSGDPATVVYYLPGTTGWGTTYGTAPTELWNPQATAFTTAGNQFGFNIIGPTNATIVVEACTNLANPVWLPVSTITLSGNGTSSFSDPQQANYPNRYYRFSAP